MQLCLLQLKNEVHCVPLFKHMEVCLKKKLGHYKTTDFIFPLSQINYDYTMNTEKYLKYVL